VKLSAFHFGFENYPSLCLGPKSDPFMVNLHGEPHRMEREGQNHYGQNDEKIGLTPAPSHNLLTRRVSFLLGGAKDVSSGNKVSSIFRLSGDAKGESYLPNLN